MAEGGFVPAATAGPDPIALLFRHVLDERRRALFPPGARVLEIRSEAPQAEGAFDAALSAPGVLDGVEVPWLASWLSRVLRPGAPLLLSVTNVRPLPALLALALTGRGEWRSPRATPLRGGPGGSSPRDLREGLGPSFAWRGAFALGVLLPAAGHAGWAAERPQLFGLLAAAESLVRRRPVFRGLGAFTVLEGFRR
jgi:hypothetical protein